MSPCAPRDPARASSLRLCPFSHVNTSGAVSTGGGGTSSLPTMCSEGGSREGLGGARRTLLLGDLYFTTLRNDLYCPPLVLR